MAFRWPQQETRLSLEVPVWRCMGLWISRVNAENDTVLY